MKDELEELKRQGLPSLYLPLALSLFPFLRAPRSFRNGLEAKERCGLNISENYKHKERSSE